MRTKLSPAERIARSRAQIERAIVATERRLREDWNVNPADVDIPEPGSDAPARPAAKPTAPTAPAKPGRLDRLRNRGKKTPWQAKCDAALTKGGILAGKLTERQVGSGFDDYFRMVGATRLESRLVEFQSSVALNQFCSRIEYLCYTRSNAAGDFLLNLLGEEDEDETDIYRWQNPGEARLAEDLQKGSTTNAVMRILFECFGAKKTGLEAFKRVYAANL